MTERIDHAAEAREELDAIQLHFDEGENGTARATMALTHATLALVEQQRIANLAAMWGEDSSGAIRDALVEKVDDRWRLRPDIAAALGLEA